MFKKIKEKLIHYLGGITLTESNVYANKRAYLCLNDIREYANSMYGISANEWAGNLYSKIASKIEELGQNI